VLKGQAVGAPTSYLCCPVISFWFLIFFSEVFKDSFKVLSQHYRHKLTKLALCISGVNRIHVQDSQAAFFLQGLSCFHFDS